MNTDYPAPEPDERAWADAGMHEWYQEYDQAQHSHRSKHMKIDQMLESRFLKQSDIDGEPVVTVKAVTKANVAAKGEDPEYRWTVTFKEYEKPMVMNATNIKRMGKALGDDTDDWPGGQVIIYVDTEVEFGGKIVGGLRVRPVPRGKTTPRQPSMDDINRDLRKQDDDIAF